MVTPAGPERPRLKTGAIVRMFTAGVILALILILSAGYVVGRADGNDETIFTVQVSAAEHEAQEGYFTLGDSATIMVKPGSKLYRYLSRQRGKTIRITMTDAGRPDLSRLER